MLVLDESGQPNAIPNYIQRDLPFKIISCLS